MQTTNPAANGALTADQLACEYAIDPIGIDEQRPRLSFKLVATADAEAARGLRQSAYQIRVASDSSTLRNGTGDLWDSGRVQSDQTVFIDYAGRKLKSGERAWWAVRVWDQNEQCSNWSMPASWEMGLLARDEWKAQWIGSTLVGGKHTEVPAPFFRKAFELPKKQIASARLYVTALGLYEFHLNGRKVGDHVFAPFWTDYETRVQYQVHDITAQLTSDGANVAGAILGDGWYSGYTGNINRRQYYGDRPKLFAQIVVRFADGTVQTIVTDDTWKTATGPILSSDLFMGESYDARLEHAGWDAGGFDDSAWHRVTVFADPGIALTAMIGPPVRAIQEIKPKQITRDGGRFIADFGQNLVGYVRLNVNGPAGETVKLQFVEVLDEHGHPYTANLRTAKQTDVYTLRGDPAGETFEPKFTFHGFRYASVAGYPGDLSVDDIVAVVLHSDMPQTGSFECSEPLLNQLQRNIEWGQRGNFLDVPTDCPQRDERLGWTGDAQVFIRTAAFNFNVGGFFAKWSQDLRDAQKPGGQFPQVAPNNSGHDNRTESSHFDGGPAWADAGVICPWTMYLVSGDRRLLESHYESMTRFIDSMKEAAEPFGLIRSHPEWKGWHGFGDWLATDSGRDNPFGATPKDLIGTAFLSHGARLVSNIAKVLNRSADAAKYATLGDDVAAAFCRRFVTQDGLIVGNTQTAYVLALHFDLLPESLHTAAADTLVQLIKANGNKLTTGFVGSPYLNHVLTRAGKLDTAYNLLMQQNWPSWLYAVTKGATTIWERWDGWTHDRGFQNAGMNSFNHYAYGAIGAWLYAAVAGLDIDPDRPGYSHVIFRPHPKIAGPLTYAKASLETVRGRVESGWTLDGNRLTYDIRVPPNVMATVYWPAADINAVSESGRPAKGADGVSKASVEDGRAVFELASGRYRFIGELAP